MYTSNPVVFLVCDSDYIKYLVCFLHNLQKNSPNSQVYIHFINTDTSTIRNILQKFKCVKNFTSEEKDLNYKNTRTALPPFSPLRHTDRMFINSELKGFGKLYSEKSAYCANIRFSLIDTHLKSYNNDIIYIDVDNIINKSITSLNKLLKHNKWLAVPCLKNHNKLSTTLFGIQNNEYNQTITSNIVKDIKPNILDWGIDHISYNKRVAEFKLLSDDYSDEDYTADSVIWVNHLTMYGVTDKYERIINEVYCSTDSLL